MDIDIHITWTSLKWFGLTLFLLGLLALFTGDLPDSPGSRIGNTMRWIIWPLFWIWVLIVFFVGLSRRPEGSCSSGTRGWTACSASFFRVERRT